MKTNKDKTIFFRVDKMTKLAVQTIADSEGMRISEWIRTILELKLKQLKEDKP